MYRNIKEFSLSKRDIDIVLDYICSVATQRKIFYLWRPFLKDSKDDIFLELAVESQSKIIITFNKKDFQGVEKFGIKLMTPKEFLFYLGDYK